MNWKERPALRRGSFAFLLAENDVAAYVRSRCARETADEAAAQ